MREATLCTEIVHPRGTTLPIPAAALDSALLRTLLSVAFLLTLLSESANAQSNHVRTPYVDAKLVSEFTNIAPNRSFWVGLRFKIRPGWHTYWLNPGDSGLATSIDWELPEGIAAGAIRWPVPERFPVGHLMNFGYSDEVVLLTRMSGWPAIAALSNIEIAANARWLVCEDICIMEQGRFELNLPVTANTPMMDSGGRALIAKYARRLPAPAHEPAQFFATRETIRLRVPLPPDWPRVASDVWFYPENFGIVDHAALQQTKSYGNGLDLTLTRGDLKHESLERLSGVLVLRYGKDDLRGLSVTAQPG